MPELNYWIDSHAHLFSKQFDNDRGDVIERLRAANVQKVVMPNVDHASIDAMLELESRQPELCFATMGLHPCSVDNSFQRELYIVEDWLSKRKFAAIGEIGTDLYWDKTFWEQQQEAFLIQVSWARQYEIPIIIHCRESLEQTIALVEQAQDGTLTGVFHCFTGTVEQAERISRMGFFIGIGGVATFKKGGLDAVLPQVDIDSIVLETDCPYLAPVPHRGKRNEPAYLTLIAEKVAALKGLSVEHVQSKTTENSLRLFPAIG